MTLQDALDHTPAQLGLLAEANERVKAASALLQLQAFEAVLYGAFGESGARRDFVDRMQRIIR